MSLVAYDAASSSEEEGEGIGGGQAVDSASGQMMVVAAPNVDESSIIDFKLKNEFTAKIDPNQKELTYNIKYDDMFAPEVGPQNPFTANQMKNKNFLTGHVETAHVNE